MPKLSPFLATVATLLSVSLPAMATDLEQEYVQVRKIALKDPRVHDAFEKANERLDEKILQIDPSLKPIVEREHGKPAEPRKTTVEHRPSPSPAPAARQNEHVVVKGETLSSIAGHYKVTVTAIEKANHITDERKLKVGQKLAIPTAENSKAKPAQEAKPDDNGGWWNDLKKNL